MLYVEMQAELSTNPDQREFDFEESDRRRSAGELLRWALHGDISNRKFEWPSDLPRPEADPAHAGDVHCANEIFLCSCGFVEHHEFAHIRLGHDDEADVVSQEKEADYAAADWIMDGVESGSPAFEKRAMGISVALLSLASTQAYTKSIATKHPQPYDRVFHVLSRFLTDDNHLSWAVTHLMLNLHLQHCGATLPDLDATMTHANVVDQFVDALSRHVTG